MTLIQRTPGRGRPMTAALVALVAITLGAAAPVSASSGSSRRCPDGTPSVYDGPAPTEAGGFVFDDGEFRTFTRADAVAGSPTDINNRGDIVGGYSDTAGIQHGFRVDRQGCFSLVEFPGEPRTLNEAIGINDRRQITGTYGDYGDERTTLEGHGYVRNRGRFTSIDVPGAVVTGAFKNNNRGQIVGSYSNETRGRVGVGDAHGFLLDDGELTRIDAPGAIKTTLHDINERGQILGVGQNADNTEGFGFVRDRRGHYRRLPDVPGAQATIPLGLNNRGQVVGIYIDRDGAEHGYLFRRGRFQTIDVPGAAATNAFGINDRGQIVGAFRNTTAPPTPATMDVNPTTTDP
jgi:uncharacterized membrane protein